MLIIKKLLEHQLNNPNHVAFYEGERDINYQDFALQAQHISKVLQSHGVNNESRVAIFMPRGIDAALSIYATLFLGAAYIPLDTQNPITRLTYITNDVQPKCMIGFGDQPDWCSKSITWIDINKIQIYDVTQTNNINSYISHHDESLAAILYTSGSTGNPKGVAISYRAIQAFVAWSSKAFQIHKDDHIASLAPFHFDLSLFDLFTSVSNAASIHFIPQRFTLSPKKLVDWFEEKLITTWYTVPSILNFLTLRGGLNSERLPAFKRILFAGEVFPLPNLIKLTKALPHIEFYNLFGPTETNVCTFWKVERSILEDIDTIPIGVAACSAELNISHEGEMLVQGPSVMSGYWVNGRLQKNTNLWHHTGDKVSQNSNHNFFYHGRMDRMIKSSGYRIEPAEVEHHINQFEAVEESVVIGEADAISGQRLVAVVSGNNVDIPALRTHLKNSVATYMQPYRFIQLDLLPHLSNGKLDHQLLIKQVQQLSSNT